MTESGAGLCLLSVAFSWLGFCEVFGREDADGQGGNESF